MTAEGRLVVDASIAAKWFLPEQYRLESRALLNRYVGRMIAPTFLTAELGNVFIKKVRGALMSEGDARRALAAVPEQVDLLPHADIVRSSMTIALQHNRSFYDAMYVALALDEGCQLVTADERLYNALMPALPATMLWVGDMTSA